MINRICLFLVCAMATLLSSAASMRLVNVEMESDANTALSLIQDRTGMIWVGTNQGLYNYDGYHLHCRYLPHQPENVRTNTLMLLGDTLCLGTSQGILAMNLRTDSYFQSPVKLQEDVRALLEDGDYLWIGTLNGLYRYTRSTRQLDNVSKGLPHMAVYALQKGSDGNIYIGTFNGLCRFVAKSKQMSVLRVPNNDKGSLFVNSLLRDDDRNCIWIGTEEGLWKYDVKTDAVSSPVKEVNSCVKSMALMPDRRLAVGTDNGLILWKEDGFSVTYNHDARMTYSLADDNVWSLLCDNDGNLWAGTNSNISVLPRQTDIKTIAIADVSDCTSGFTISCFLRDKGETLWIGGDKGILKFPSNGGCTWFHKDSSHPLNHNVVRSIYVDPQNDMWLATDGGVNLYDTSADRFKPFLLTDKNRKLSALWTHRVVEDQGGRIYVASYLGGILAIDKQKLLSASGDGCIADLAFGKDSGLTSDNVLQLAIDQQGNKWAILSNGTLVCISAKQQVRIVRLGYDVSRILLVGNEVWLGADGKLMHISVLGDVLDVIELPVYEYITAMERVRDNFWVSTPSGVWSVDPRSGKCHLLQLPNNRYTCIYYDRATEQAYLGTKDKYLCVDVERATVLRGNAKQLTFTNINVNGDDYRVEEGSIRNITELRLPHQKSYVEVCFSDLVYAFDAPLRYEYRLVDKGKEESDDIEWSIVDGMTIWLDFMHSGHYVLQIRSLYQPDVVCQLPITVSRPWYATPWAWLAYLFILCIVGYSAYIIYLSRRREASIRRTQDRMDFLTNISHELKTPLSLIVGPVSQMLANSKSAENRRRLEGVYHNALQLNSLIQSALEVHHSGWAKDDTPLYSHLEMVRFCGHIVEGHRANQPNKNIIFTTSVETLHISTDIVKMESILNNLLTNACKYSGDDATIALTLTVHDEHVLIRISDDGEGISGREQQLVFQRLYQTEEARRQGMGCGIGLHLVKSYTEMLGGKISVESAKGVGSVFSLLIPIRRDAEQEGDVLLPTPVEGDTRKKVLIVEDNEALADFLVDSLKKDYYCLHASNGKSGLAICSSVLPDLMIVDVMMPVMNGIDMLRFVKQSHLLSTVPVIMLTAKDDKDTENMSIQLGADCFMSKPFDMPQLMGRIRQLLKAKEELRSSVIVEHILNIDANSVESSDERTLAQLTQFIEDNLSNTDLNVTMVCEHLHIPSKTLYRLVKKYLDVSLVEYIRQVRIKKAAMLFDQNKLSISEVMYMVGFASPSYFAKCFQTQFGYTPKQYIAREAKDGDPQ